MITSHMNVRMKRLVNLTKKKKLREEENVFIVEGIRMFREVPPHLLQEVYVSESFYKKERTTINRKVSEANRERKNAAAGKGEDAEVRAELVSDSVFEYISDTKTPQGVLCVVRQPQYDVDQILTGKRAHAGKDGNQTAGDVPHLILLECLQDPGNLGTIFRTAEAAGATGIILSRDCVDIYNPKTTRSTMGAIFRMPFCYVENIRETVKELRGKGVSTYAAHLEDSVDYDQPDYTKASALLIGNEGNGLTRETADLADQYVKIPMAGEAESLNAAVAAAVLMYEVNRQRRHENSQS